MGQTRYKRGAFFRKTRKIVQPWGLILGRDPSSSVMSSKSNCLNFSSENDTHKLGVREGSLFMGWGGAGNNGNRYNCRESPYLRKIFFTCPFIFPKESKIIDVQKFFAPPLLTPRKFFAPPSRRREKFSPPLRQKKIMCPKCFKNKKKCILRMFGKKLTKSKKFSPPFGECQKFVAPPLRDVAKIFRPP